jgi:uncharacterized protein YdhG (YjbR/CyaY superfamily)
VPTTPTAPTINSVTAGDSALVVAFTAAADGGSTITNYKYSKGAIQFPIDQPLPKELIQDILRFRIEEDFLKKKK